MTFSSLDVGCGTRNLGNIGLDLHKQDGVNLIADAHHLPFKDEAFNGCFANALLEHVNNPLQVLREIHRVLKIDGTLNLLLPRGSRMLPFIAKEILLFRWRHCWEVYKGLHRGMHKWQFTLKNTREILLKTGFQINFLGHKLDHRLPFTGNIVATAIKRR